MKNLGKIFFGILLGIAATLLMGRGCKHKDADRAAKEAAKKETSVIADINKHRFDSVQYYRDQFDQEHAQKALILGDEAAIKIFYKKKEDSLCTVLHLRNAQLKDMTDVVSQVNGSFTTGTQTVGEQDIISGKPAGWKGYMFQYKDDYMQETGFVDSVTTEVHYQLTIPVSITTFWKRKWFLGKKHYFIDGFSTNKNVHITGLSGVSIKR